MREVALGVSLLAAGLSVAWGVWLIAGAGVGLIVAGVLLAALSVLVLAEVG